MTETIDSDPVYELRTYTVPEGRMAHLEARFRDHTIGFFEKHGMQSVGYWTAPATTEGERLMYLLRHLSIEAKERSWETLLADPEWVQVKKRSEENGLSVLAVDSTLLTPTAFSQMQ